MIKLAPDAPSLLGSALTMVSDPRSPLLRRRRGRTWLALILVVLTVANLSLGYYCAHRMNPWPVLLGLVVGGMLTQLLLIVAIWRRQPWARYVLIFYLWAAIGVFGIAILSLTNDLSRIDRKPFAAAVAGVCLYLLANVWIIRSRSVQHIAQPGSSRG